MQHDGPTGSQNGSEPRQDGAQFRLVGAIGNQQYVGNRIRIMRTFLVRRVTGDMGEAAAEELQQKLDMPPAGNGDAIGGMCPRRLNQLVGEIRSMPKL
jgi:hypothetical protein